MSRIRIILEALAGGLAVAVIMVAAYLVVWTANPQVMGVETLVTPRGDTVIVRWDPSVTPDTVELRISISELMFGDTCVDAMVNPDGETLTCITWGEDVWR